MFNISNSSLVISVLLLSTNIINDALSIKSKLFFTPILSTTSSVYLIPAVSIKLSLMPLISTEPSTISRVVPGISVTIALSSSSSLFKILLLPTLGFPIITVSIPSLIIFESLELLSNVCNSSDISTNFGLIISLLSTVISSYSGKSILTSILDSISLIFFLISLILLDVLIFPI